MLFKAHLAKARAQADRDILTVTQEFGPFADMGNPVMAQLAFLATMISPKVAAAAAQGALTELARGAESSASTSQGGALDDVSALMASEEPVSRERMLAAATAGLAAAAVRAKRMADSEDCLCRKIVVEAAQAVVARIEAKLKLAEQIDKAIRTAKGDAGKMLPNYINQWWVGLVRTG